VEEEKAKSYAMAFSDLEKWREEPTAPITVIIPPSHEDSTPMTFGEWVNDFGIEELRDESNEEYEYYLNLNKYLYKTYLKDNGYEHHLDQYRAHIDTLRATERKEFDFKPEGEKELLSFRRWVKRERLAVLKKIEERANAYPRKGRSHERFEHELELYGRYLKASTPDDSTVLDEFRAHIAEGHRRQVTELTHKVNDNDLSEATEPKSPTRANTKAEGEPMSFEEWTNSPLAWRSSHLAKNSNASLRADLRDYTSYLHSFPGSERLADSLHAKRTDLETHHILHFSFNPRLNFTFAWDQQTPSYASFNNTLVDQGYKRSREWASDAYLLFLGSLPDQVAVTGFTITRDWWARADRRELCGLPREDPFVVKITSVLQRLAQLVDDADQYPIPGAGYSAEVQVQGCLEEVILMLNSCLETNTEPTSAQWEEVRTAYHRGQAMISAAVEQRRRFGEMILMVGSWSDTSTEVDGEDWEHENDGPIVPLTYVPDRDSDDEGSSDEEDEWLFASIEELLEALLADGEWDDEE
jgi:hypothetical protein